MVKVVKALQTQTPVQLCFTNYKKNGQEFQNLFSMKPVHDSDGEYRYTVGVQMEVDRRGPTDEQTAALKDMMKQLPSKFLSSLMPLAELSKEEKLSASARNAQLRQAMEQCLHAWEQAPVVASSTNLHLTKPLVLTPYS